MTSKPRYLLVGTGHRARMYFGAMAGPHRAVAELVGLIDTNPGRLAVHPKLLAEEALSTSARWSPGSPTTANE